MSDKKGILWGIAAIAATSALAACGDGDGSAPSEVHDRQGQLDELRKVLDRDAPGSHVSDQSGVIRTFGAPVSSGPTPEQSLKSLIAAHAQALGTQTSELKPLELTGGQRKIAKTSNPLGLMFDKQTGSYKFYLYRYGQERAGVRVFGSEMLALVKNRANNPVVWSSSSLKPLGNFTPNTSQRPAAPDAQKSLAALQQRMRDFTGRPIGGSAQVTHLSNPRITVFAGAGATAARPTLAIEYTAETTNPPGRWSFVASADTADVLHVESLVVFQDISGTVTGHVTEGAVSMDCAAESSVPFPLAEVSIVGGSSAFADTSGQFLIPNAGNASVDVNSLIGGTYFDVNNIAGGNESLTQSVAPPGPATFVHNEGNASDAVRAQTNGYVNAMQVRDFLLSYVPDYPTISTQQDFPVNVNRTDLFCPGNAWYDGSSINFCVGSATYGNTSFASISHHEFGHHIVNTGGSGQGAYGEGMSDVVAALLAGDPGLGYGFFFGQCTTPLRTADNDCQYQAVGCSSCGSEAHACGNLISGTIWSIREALSVTDSENYHDILNALVLSSIPMHTGTSIDSSIAIDLLTLDDDDGLLANGTPHYTEICAGFEAHGMSCPPLETGLGVAPADNVSAEGPTGGPFSPSSFDYTVLNLGPDAPIDYQVSTLGTPTWLTVVGGSGQLALDAQATVTLELDQAQAALLPNGKHTATVAFTNLTNGVGNTTRDVELTVGIPDAIFTADFESGLGGFTLDTGTTNLWHLSTGCAASASGHSTPTSLYFGSDATCNFAVGAVSGTATSPSIQVADTSLALVQLNYYLATEQNPSFDRAAVQVAVNGGAFTTIASNFGTGAALVDSSGVWQPLEVDISSLIGGLPSADLQLRMSFASGDAAFNNFEGFHVDDVLLLAFAEACVSDADCDDGLACSGTETCAGGSCVPGTPLDCDDGIACTSDSCNETAGCVNAPDDVSCSDGSVCTGVETCDATLGCVPGTPLDCNDGNLCTVDSCDAVQGCLASPLDCDDGNACTADACDAVLGCTSEALDCNDQNECTADSCDTELGCQNTPASGSCSDDGDSCTDDICSSGMCTHPDNGSCEQVGAFLESGGSVVMEAENFHAYIPRASHTWDLVSNGSASGGELLLGNPNINANFNTGYVGGSPELTYDVQFETVGTYYVWVRGIGSSGDDDSCHVGIDGVGPASADRISSFSQSLTWSRNTMDGPVATLDVTSTGLHTISVWMREDGFQFDKLILTTDPNFTPSGLGPAESPQGEVEPELCGSDVDCDDGNSCTNNVCNAGVCSFSPVADGSLCDADSNECTDDVCNAGVCTHPNNTGECTDDGNTCTDDVCSGGICTHPDNGSCPGMGPCAAFCTNPVQFSGNYQSGNLGTAATCHESVGLLNGGVCGNFVGGRTLSVNGQAMPCTGNWPFLPAPVNGGYCVTTTAGDHPWAYFATW